MKKEEYIITADSLQAYEKMDTRLFASDLILMLLSVHSIQGNTKLQKQVFLGWKEIFNDISCDLAFFPWKYGAFSTVVENAVTILLKQGYIKLLRRRGEGSIYSITDKGRKRINKRLAMVGLDLRDLPKRKADWDEWSPKGILRHVYRKYPQYTSKTEVPSLKW
jgi:uncharacterized protein YwgA